MSSFAFLTTIVGGRKNNGKTGSPGLNKAV